MKRIIGLIVLFLLVGCTSKEEEPLFYTKSNNEKGFELTLEANISNNSQELRATLTNNSNSTVISHGSPIIVFVIVNDEGDELHDGGFIQLKEEQTSIENSQSIKEYETLNYKLEEGNYIVAAIANFSVDGKSIKLISDISFSIPQSN